MTKPKIGLLFVTSGWFRQVGLQTSESRLSELIENIAADIMARLEPYIQVVYDGILYSEGAASDSGKNLAEVNLDGLILAPLMWCEDQIPVAALKHLQKLPVLLCNFLPDERLPAFLTFQNMLKGSGSVGVLQLSGYLRRAGYHYRSISGYYKDQSVYHRIKDQCRAFQIKKALQQVVCGVLPFPCDQMLVTHIDDAFLKDKYGIKVRYLSLDNIKNIAQAVTEDKIREMQSLLGEVKINVKQKDLEKGIRYALALEKTVDAEHLDILAINDVCDEIHQSFGLRPCLENPRLTARGLVVSMEADVAAGIAMFLSQKVTAESPFYCEILNGDILNNTLLLGHAGYHNSVHADPDYPIRIIPDIEYKDAGGSGGACIYFKYKAGPVTAINCIFDGTNLQMMAFEGESLPGNEKLEGYCHLLCRIDLQIERFYDKVLTVGSSQHWIIVPGHHLESLATLCEWLDIKFINVGSS